MMPQAPVVPLPMFKALALSIGSVWYLRLLCAHYTQFWQGPARFSDKQQVAVTLDVFKRMSCNRMCRKLSLAESAIY